MPLIHLPLTGDLLCFRLFAVMNNAIANILLNSLDRLTIGV